MLSYPIAMIRLMVGMQMFIRSSPRSSKSVSIGQLCLKMCTNKSGLAIGVKGLRICLGKNYILEVEVFNICGIDFMGPFPSS